MIIYVSFQAKLDETIATFKMAECDSGQLGFHLRDDKNALMAQTADNTNCLWEQLMR